MLFIVLVNVGTTFSNFQATFLLLGISPQKSEKYDETLVPKSVGLGKKWGDDVVDHVMHF